MQLNPTAIINKTKQAKQRERTHNVNQYRVEWKHGATAEMNYFLNNLSLTYIRSGRAWAYTFWKQSLYTSPNLEEAMSRISLSQPEGSILGYVHVGSFQHPLIYPVKHIESFQEQPNTPKTNCAILNHANSFPEEGIDSHKICAMHMVSPSASSAVPERILTRRLQHNICSSCTYKAGLLEIHSIYAGPFHKIEVNLWMAPWVETAACHVVQY